MWLGSCGSVGLIDNGAAPRLPSRTTASPEGGGERGQRERGGGGNERERCVCV